MILRLFLYVSLYGWMVVNCVRRYAFVDNEIKEMKAITEPEAWIFSSDKSKSSINSAEYLLIDHLLEREKKNQLNTWSWIGYGDQYGKSFEIDVPSYALSLISNSSIFCIAKNGKVFERFFNGIQWVYVQHMFQKDKVYRRMFTSGSWTFSRSNKGRPSNAISITSVDIDGEKRGILMGDSNGRLFHRENIFQGRFDWVDITMDNEKVLSGGISGPNGEVFFATNKGNLAEYDFMHHIWKVHDTMKPFYVTRIIDVYTFKTGSVFAITNTGILVEYCQDTWIDHGQPRNSVILQQKAITVPSLSGDQSLFFVSSIGIVEFTKENSWLIHGEPFRNSLSSSKSIRSGLGTYCSRNDRIYFVTQDRHLASFLVLPIPNGESRWVDHGHPEGSLLSFVSPLSISHTESKDGVDVVLDVIVVFTVEGQISYFSHSAENESNKNDWEWSVHNVPEGGNAQYCSSDIEDSHSCVKQTQ